MYIKIVHPLFRNIKENIVSVSLFTSRSYQNSKTSFLINNINIGEEQPTVSYS